MRRFRALAGRHFYPRSPCGERRPGLVRHGVGIAISIHALLAESDPSRPISIIRHSNFYPRSPCGERHVRITHNPGPCYFYPRSPCGERHHGNSRRLVENAISIHALLAESDAVTPVSGHRSRISIHALLAESDLLIFATRQAAIGVFLSTLSLRRATQCRRPRPQRLFISIHALLAESDSPSPKGCRSPMPFLSTLSLRRATRWARSRRWRSANFYPRSPCGERQAFYNAPHIIDTISIHALLAESDPQTEQTPPPFWISIHALLAESDRRPGQTAKTNKDFYPRSPCGERLIDTSKDVIKTANFYPRSPCGERRKSNKLTGPN